VRQRPRAFFAKYKRLNGALAELVEEYSLLSYVPLTLREPEALLKLAKIIDKAGGFVPLRHDRRGAAPGRPRAARRWRASCPPRHGAEAAGSNQRGQGVFGGGRLLGR
jgi:hypothetical protein